MKFLRTNTNINIVISVTLHAVVLALLLPHQFKHKPIVNPGDNDHNAVDAYVFQELIRQPVKQTPQQQNKTGIPIKTKKIERKKKPVVTKQRIQSRAASKGQYSRGLLALLHNAIQKHQIYPDAAMEMEREGRTTVKFTLFQDGHIDHVAIAASSGTQLLDSAAINAVKAAAPFVGAEHYLKHTEDYRIDVVFELG